MTIFFTCVKCRAGAVFLVGLWVRWGSGDAGYNRYVRYYVQIPCQTGENRQKYRAKRLDFDNFTRFINKNGKFRYRMYSPDLTRRMFSL